MKINKIKAYEILDSRGNPTIEVEMASGKISASASVPSGASTGVYESVELRDGDPSRYNGKGVLKAAENVNKTIAESILGINISSQKKLDSLLISLDGTENKGKLGVNAILGVSLAFAKLMACKKKMELYEYFGSLGGNMDYKIPTPSFNIINGGKHSDSGLDIQEFMVQPIGFPNFADKLRAGAEIFHSLKKILSSRGDITSVGDEGGFAPHLKSNEEGFEVIIEAIQKAGYSTDKVKIGIDAAASSFYKEGKYNIRTKEGIVRSLTSQELVGWYKDLLEKYPINSIEDGFAEDDWNGFVELKKNFGDKIIVVGDDLLVTNIKKIKQAIKKQAVNSVLIKLNQIGTVTETIKAIMLAKSQNWIPFISHRSGETEDSYIADLAVGLKCQFIKTGAPCRSERLAKYNRLLKIEAKLENK